MTRTLTSAFVESLKPGTDQFEERDAKVPGLRICIYPSGVRSWVLRYRLHGRRRS